MKAYFSFRSFSADKERNYGIIVQLAAKLFNRIARSHMYWGRKPLVGLLQAFEDVHKGVVLDPFCGAGTPTVAALLKGARVVATDLNPMSAFMTRVLTRPLSIPGLRAAFDSVFAEVAPKAEPAYRLTCHTCGKVATANFILWKGPVHDAIPIAAKVECGYCRSSTIRPLSAQEEKHERRASQVQPKSWYPDNTIHTASRRPPVLNNNQLFTGRNLSILAEVIASIDKIESQTYKETLQYIFTASLYSCSQMQMFSKDQPTSTRGWAALRFYIPPLRKEANVMHAFARRFETFLSCKQELNAVLPSIQVTQKQSEFIDGADVFVGEMDWSESLEVFGPVATHVFLDPPYNVDVDYFGFSEFWGAWLRMPFDFKGEWHARKVKGDKTSDLLNRTARVTSLDCRVTLALDPKDPAGWETETAIASGGYRVNSTGYFLYDNSIARGKKAKQDLLRRRDRYYTLEHSNPSSGPAKTHKVCAREEESTEATYPYLRATAFLFGSESSTEILRARTANNLLPRDLRNLCDRLTYDEIMKAHSDGNRNQRTYRSLCLALVNLLLQTDQWYLLSTKTNLLEPGVFGLPKPTRTRMPQNSEAVAIFASRDGTIEIHVFFSDQDEATLREGANRIRKRDSGRYRQIALLLLPERKKMDEWRMVSRANRWPRGFFVAFDELRAQCARAVPERYQAICSPPLKPTETAGCHTKIASFKATVKDNVQVGGPDSLYYKLQFEASGLTGIVPGQFTMLDTVERHPSDGVKSVPWRAFTTSFATAPQTYLKRPFGIHRAFYPYFQRDYLRHMKLPRSLASVMHTALPKAFDVFYKVLRTGKGTNEMRNLSPGTRVGMIGPLGRRFDIRTMINEGVDEVHVIGGGVGMAPLIFLVQALRYFGVAVKAFIGIETTELLKYQENLIRTRAQADQIDEGFAAGVRDVTIYVDDLADAGVDRSSDIFVSYDRLSAGEPLVPRKNYAKGFVSEQYKRYLLEHPRKERLVAFACGPTPMMKAIHDIAKAHTVRLFVLMEKRMACGIGVCLSCVCKTTTSPSGYSRVCKDGPVFDANEIVWS